jgi:hypothetical protein
MKKIIFLILILIVLGLPQTIHAAAKPTIGVIKYDAWTYNRVPGSENDAHYLNPEMWHYRVPAYGKIISSTEVQMEEDDQAVIDQEILDASAAGIDYFAFDFARFSWADAHPEGRVFYGLDRYLASQYKNKLNFALLVTEIDPLSHYEDTFVPKVVEYMKQSTYQKVLNGRPILYMFMGGPDLIKYFNCPVEPYQEPPPCTDTSLTKTQEGIAYLRQQVVAAGLGNPYMVDMVWWPETDGVQMKNVGFDAVTQYSAPDYDSGTFDVGRPFSDLVAANALFRTKAQQAGLKAVPIVNTGWDSRPRWIDSGEGHNNWYVPGTPAQIASNLKAAIDWGIKNPTTSEAKTVLIYAWDEYAEGGWLGNMLTGGNERLDAIKAMLSAYSTPTPTPTTNKPGDLNSDGKVDINDYNLLMANFGKTGTGVVGDIDGNGKVDIFDYNILVGSFGK